MLIATIRTLNVPFIRVSALSKRFSKRSSRVSTQFDAPLQLFG
jgi:hypothetical protein